MELAMNELASVFMYEAMNIVKDEVKEENKIEITSEFVDEFDQDDDKVSTTDRVFTNNDILTKDLSSPSEIQTYKSGDFSKSITNKASYNIKSPQKTMGKIPWSRASESMLLRLVQQQRYLWDPNEPHYKKQKRKNNAFNTICSILMKEFPELYELNGEIVRRKFKNLRTYFMSQVKKMKETPSSEGNSNYESKWILFDVASYLADATDDPSILALTAASKCSSDPSVVPGAFVTCALECGGEDNNILQDYVHQSTSEEMTQMRTLHSPEDQSSSSYNEASPKSTTNCHSPPPILGKRKRKDSDCDNIKEALCAISNYLTKKSKPPDSIAANLGKIVEIAAGKMPYEKQLDFMHKINKLIIEETDDGDCQA